MLEKTKQLRKLHSFHSSVEKLFHYNDLPSNYIPDLAVMEYQDDQGAGKASKLQ